MGVGLEAGKRHVTPRATEGRASTGLGALCQGGDGGRLCSDSQVSSFVGANVLEVVIAEVTTRLAKAR